MAPRGDDSSALRHPESPASAPAANAAPRGAATQAAQPLDFERFCWLVGSICNLHGAPFDADVLRQRHPPPHDVAQLSGALGELGFDLAPLAVRSLDGRQRVAGAFAHLHAEGGDDEWVLLASCDGHRIACFEFAAATPRLVARDEFIRRCSAAWLPRRRAPTLTDPDTPPAREPFGFRWFAPELLRHRGIWRDVLLASLAIQALALGLPLMTQAVIDKVVVHRTESTLIALAVGLAIFTIFSAALSWIRQYLILHTGTRVDAVLGAAVFRHLTELPASWFEQRPTGVIAARLHGVEQIREFLASSAVALLLDVPFLSLCLAIMLYYSLPLTCLTLGVLGVIAVASVAVAPLFQARLNREFVLGARNQAFLTEHVAGIETVKSLQMEPLLQRRYGDYLAAHLQAGLATRQLGNTYLVVAATLEQALMLAILVGGAYLVMNPPESGDAVLTIGMLIAFQMLAGRLGQPLIRIVGLWQQFQHARLAVARLADVMNAAPEPYAAAPQRSTAASAGQGSPAIELRQLAFRHAVDRPLLYENLDLVVRHGECVLVRGASGCGKSTLAKLLLGFHRPTSGRVLVGGVDSRHLTANELRAMFGVVPQETVLFCGTLLDNLRRGNPAASFDEVVQCCRIAQVHEDIERLPQGYQTEVGERGVGLSGGQRQRIAIARALLRKPRVLLFDEATSSLDAATASAFVRTVAALRGSATMLFIAHAVPPGLRFDRIVELGARAGVAE